MIKIAPVISFANAMKGRGFNWGTNDCNTVTLKFLDMIMEGHPDYTSITSEIVGKYGTANNAYHFYKNFGKTWDEYLLGFCDKNPDKPTFQAGDIIMKPLNRVMGSHVCLGGKSLSVDPEEGSIIISTVELLRLGDIDIYRPRL